MVDEVFNEGWQIVWIILSVISLRFVWRNSIRSGHPVAFTRAFIYTSRTGDRRTEMHQIFVHLFTICFCRAFGLPFRPWCSLLPLKDVCIHVLIMLRYLWIFIINHIYKGLYISPFWSQGRDTSFCSGYIPTATLQFSSIKKRPSHIYFTSQIWVTPWCDVHYYH